MVRIISIVGFLLTVAAGVQAQGGSPCQCLFSDGSHCCTRAGLSQDCADNCRTATRDSDNKACAANGKYSDVSSWNAQFRASCRSRGSID
ncbi:hypothetical protein COCC4DRAFT_209590 [Bipolaris maydis ATCC 48331]|uniref:Extracellular membrane protein CFEM domain-containing protein n=2 Tax=Cochliobolus heterostrophus TaxID=5016 RepID=M2TUR6_COCH5|nr:uncharacterized protein COCC4DRAFT_209590 [Bipolaris maydis ATCC 48331]EMD85486.1 hypothetical protein COCHEDRAFT_1187891 [Bipolaris maydis C5]ENH98501.1 hypothetical protein COCC4DRAFT_209590 [Bipolaris maydis ATCC 48331]